MVGLMLTNTLAWPPEDNPLQDPVADAERHPAWPAFLPVNPLLQQPSALAAFHLEGLIEEGLAVLATKQKAPATVIGDWQSVETVYAVVAADAFATWQAKVLAYLGFGPQANATAYWDFLDVCRFAQYLEAVEGVKFLKRWQQECIL
jgi:hypothetical protein